MSAANRVTPPAGGGAAAGTQSQAKAEHQQRAQQARKAAKAAKDFHSAFPADARAAQARKLEATASLRGVIDNDTAYDQSALAVAQGYRTVARNAVSDRLEVAAGVERLQLARRTNRPVYSNQPRELEKIATGLRRGFVDHPRVFDFYANVARTADQVTANRIALLLAGSATASPEAKAEGRAISERVSFIGQPFTVALRAADGSTVDLARHNDKPTVVFLYSSANGSGSLVALNQFKKTAAADCRWVYAAVNSPAAPVANAKARASLDGTHCTLDSAESVALLERLRHRHFPSV